MKALPVLLALLLSTTHAQRLPEGKLNTVRERTYDILHYKVNLSFEIPKGKVFGDATITLAPLRRVDSISLDAFALAVSSVRDARKDAGLSFRSRPRTLVIKLPTARSAGDTLMLSIQYQATPRAGMYFRTDPENPTQYCVDTYGEGGLHANWLPIYNDVNDKFSSEFFINVPAPYVALANGKLVETIMQPEGFTIYHWLQRIPHSNYLMALNIGAYEEGQLAPAFGTIPLSFWVPRGRLKEGAFAFRNTKKMVEFFSQRFNYRYPWDKYDQVAVADYSIGAMEHTSITGLRACVLRDSTAPEDFGPPTFAEYSTPWSAEATISHELAHHWFGNNLTCNSLAEIWLNESFASYCMMLWDEESIGRNQLLFDVELAKKHYFDYVKKERTIRPMEYHHFDNPDVIYNEEHTYFKGAAILHTLRSVLGDEKFFKAMNLYLRKHEFKTVVTNDLNVAIQEATGEKLDWFFKQWITGGGHPYFEVSYNYIASSKVIDLSVKQIQPIVEGQGLFTLPVSITIATSGRAWSEKISVKKESEHFVLKCDAKPLMVSFDGAGDLVAEIDFEKEADELVYQSTHDGLAGRLRAMRQLAKNFPTKQITLETLSSIIAKPQFWADAAEAAQLLGELRTDAALKATRQALMSSDYRARKGAVLGLARFGFQAADVLREVIVQDKHADVVATAIVALAKVDEKLDVQFIRQQLSRKSWYDEIVIACIQALGDMNDPAGVPLLRQYATGNYHQHVREAAIVAWSNCAAEDKELHQVLIRYAGRSTLRVQQKAIDLLGDLYIGDGIPVLEEIVRLDFDANLREQAKSALEKIRRINP